MEVVSAAFRRRWIGKGGLILWPRGSPDLTPIDFFFWGCVKNYVYMDIIRDLNRLKARTREAAQQVTRDVLQRVWQDIGYRLNICRVTNGTHMET
jgi:hypothetical protein